MHSTPPCLTPSVSALSSRVRPPWIAPCDASATCSVFLTVCASDLTVRGDRSASATPCHADASAPTAQQLQTLRHASHPRMLQGRDAQRTTERLTEPTHSTSHSTPPNTSQQRSHDTQANPLTLDRGTSCGTGLRGDLQTRTPSTPSYPPPLSEQRPVRKFASSCTAGSCHFDQRSECETRATSMTDRYRAKRGE